MSGCTRYTYKLDYRWMERSNGKFRCGPWNDSKNVPHILQIWNCKLGCVNNEMIETVSKVENNKQVQRRSNEQFMLFHKRMDRSFWPKIKFTLKGNFE